MPFVARIDKKRYMYKGGDYTLNFQLLHEDGTPVNLGYLPDGSAPNDGTAILFVILYDELGRSVLSFANDGTANGGAVQGFKKFVFSDEANGQFILSLQNADTQKLSYGRLYAGVYFETDPNPLDFTYGNYDVNILEDLPIGIVRVSRLSGMLNTDVANVSVMETGTGVLNPADINVVAKQTFTQIAAGAANSNFNSDTGAYETIVDGQPVNYFDTGYRITDTPFADGEVQVFVNGFKVELADGDRDETSSGDDTASCYFSNDNGATARMIKDIEQNDKFYWNSLNAGFRLEYYSAGDSRNDDLDFTYEM